MHVLSGLGLIMHFVVFVCMATDEPIYIKKVLGSGGIRVCVCTCTHVHLSVSVRLSGSPLSGVPQRPDSLRHDQVLLVSAHCAE